MMFKRPFFTTNRAFALATVLGLLAGYLNNGTVFAVASVISEVFINLLKLVSLPIIFLSIVSTASSMDSVSEIKSLGKKVIKYTLFTTVIAAAVALSLYVIIWPVESISNVHLMETTQPLESPNYLKHLIQVIPSNIIQPFAENHVIGVLFIAMILSLSILSLPAHNRKTLHQLFSSLYAAIMKITTWIVAVMPIAVWAFLVLFLKDLQSGLELKSLALYLLCVVSANLIQGFVVLPLFLKWKKISPAMAARGMLPALSVAFFSKSSSAALPMAIKCAEENVG